MITILFTQFNTVLSQETLQAWCSWLSPACRHRIEKLMRPRDRQASILGRMLVMMGLPAFGIDPDTIRNIVYTGHHRPIIPAPVDFNISHSGSCIVCALSTNGPVGIDIEELKPVRIDDFRPHLSAEEYRYIIDSDDECLAFYECWTRKEAVLKADGRGFMAPLENLRFQQEEVLLDQKSWYTRPLHIIPGYAACIAAGNALTHDVPVRYIDFQELTPSGWHVTNKRVNI